MTDKEVFEEVKQRFSDPKILDLLRSGLADPDEMDDVKRALRYGDAAMRNPTLRDKLYKIFDRLLNVVKDDSTTRQMVKRDLKQLQKHQEDQAMSEDLNTANVEKAVKHDCAKHVVHEEWGKGQCIPGEHTLQDDGTVTHYDVMFDHGIEQDVPVENLTVTVSESHMHASKKKKPMMETAASDTLKGEGSAPPKIADVTPQEGGGEDTSKASKKGKPEMPMEKLKAIYEKKLTQPEMKKREEVAKAIERENPNMPMGKKMAIATATAKKVAEAKDYTVPKTSKEKNLAALAPPHDKITHADVMVGRGVSKKTMKENITMKKTQKTLREFIEQLADTQHLAEAKANLHLHAYDDAEPVRHEIEGLSNTKKNSDHVFKTMVHAVAKKTGHSHADVKDAMEASEDRHVHGMPKEKQEKVVVHKSVDDYVKHHLSTDAKNVNDSLGG